MLMKIARITLIALLAGCALPLAAADDVLLAAGRALSEQFERGDTAAIAERMTPQMRDAVGGAQGLAAFRQKVLSDAGPETGVIREDTTTSGDLRVYRRIARRNVGQTPVLMEWVLTSDNHIAGFQVRPQPIAIPSSRNEEPASIALALPFDGAWFVFWGGRTLEQNAHVVSRSQRFAYDFVVMRDGRTHAGAGARVEDYFCWDQPILAPADGVVTEAVDALPDLAPGTMDRDHPAGNHVVLKVGQREYAVLAHLRRGSVRAVQGARVNANAEVGRCGNSGNTSEPHLHFHLQDAARFGEGEGVPAAFVDYVADGQPVARGEPVKGQTVARSGSRSAVSN